ncbi:MAG: MOSC domain-containing protein [Cytophagales bacterium]|nr:MOSC domain-containing protein [Cytophagales bacterium]
MIKLLSIHVGKPREILYQGKSTTTGIFKEKVDGPIRVDRLNLEGDQQADLTVHGGPDKAVYAYPVEHYSYWRTTREDLIFAPGIFGENLSIEGLNEDEACIGDQYKIGTAVLAITSPRMPCFKLGIKMKDPKFVKDFMQAQRTGFYFKVAREGAINSGDLIEKIKSDPQRLTVNEVVRLYTTDKENKALLQKAMDTSSLPQDWRDFFSKRLRH